MFPENQANFRWETSCWWLFGRDILRDTVHLLVPFTRGDTKSHPTRQSTPLSIGAFKTGYNSLGEYRICMPLPIGWIYVKWNLLCRQKNKQRNKQKIKKSLQGHKHPGYSSYIVRPHSGERPSGPSHGVAVLFPVFLENHKLVY